MSIYFDFNVGETGYRIRRAVEDDKHDIELINSSAPNSEPLFGEVNIGALIELSTLSICMINEEKKVFGFMAFADHPNVKCVDPAGWEYWIRNLYQRFYMSRNSLFIHFLCCTDAVTDFFLAEAFISVFLNDPYLIHLLFVVPSTCPKDLLLRHGSFKKHNFYKVQPRRKQDRIGNYLVVGNRQDFCPKLKMRRAVEEDNDDIVEILDKSCPRLKQLYGEYYISELIGRHPESERRILVGDVKGRAVAVMCLNTDINYRNLQKTYDLKPYYGLSSLTPLEKEQNKRANQLFKVFGHPIQIGKWDPFVNLQKTVPQTSNIPENEVPKSKHSLPTKKISKVNFDRNSRIRQSLDQIIVKRDDSDDLSDRIYSPNLSQCALLSVANMLDEDPFDYDIVNIEQSWLKDATSFEMRPTASSVSLKKPPFYKYKKTLKKLKKLTKPLTTLQEKMSATYQGNRNAFMIELFAIRKDIDERHAFDMLEAAFDFMKEFDFCVIRIPTSDTYFPLLQHFSFVPLRPRVCCDYALYVAHRSSILGKLRVREAEIVDIPAIAHLLYPLDAKETMQSIEHMVDNNKENQAYVFTSGMSVVGVAIMELPEEVDFLRCRFNLDYYQLNKYYYEGNGIDAGLYNIKTIIAYPVFEPHFRFFTRELMRLSGASTLMYVTAYRNKWAVQKGNILVSSMIPLLPRNVEIDGETVPELKRLATMAKAIVPFSAWFINKKFTSLSKVDITTRIVIIGASRTALGFLKALLFQQPSTYITFTNVTLISTYGLPYTRHTKPIAEMMFLRYYTSSDKYLKSVPYTYYVNVIQGKMAEVNLQEKYITLTSGSRYPYDLLFLFFGKQYQHPNYMSHLEERDQYKMSKEAPEYCTMDVPRYSDTELQITSDETPENVFIINHIIEAHRALSYVNNLNWDVQDNAKVVVYGGKIHTHLCINALLAINVPPENIVLVEPYPVDNPCKTRVHEFSNENVDITMTEVLNNYKITIYRSYYFVTWSYDKSAMYDGNVVTHVEFLSYAKYLKLKCSAFFYYGRKGIDMRAFVAIHKSGLSYDGGIVIDADCCTRDPSVFAAGPHTRYLRRYYADELSHKYFDSYEIGFKLGTKIRKRLDPLFKDLSPDAMTTENLRRESQKAFSERRGTLDRRESIYMNPNLMQLKKPKVVYCTLPGGLKYLHVRAPGLKLPHYYIQLMGHNGYVLETYKRGYFKLHLTKDFKVDGITCLGPSTFSLEKFKRLYGKSTFLLKNVYLRFRMNKLTDLYEFFEAPWAFFLYHDQMDDLFAMSKELLPKDEAEGHTIAEALNESLKNLPAALVNNNLKKSPYVEAITNYVIDWLSHNDILLPMYLQPSQRAMFSYDLTGNPLFNVKKNKNTEDDSNKE